MSLKIKNALSGLPKRAAKSDMYHQHSAVVMKGGVPVVWGTNKIHGSCTHHAEHDAIRSFLASRGIRSWEKEPYILQGRLRE